MRKKQILLIDDEPDLNDILKHQIEDAHPDYECISVTNGKAGVERIEQEMPDLVLLDINMPGMDGVETLRRIRQIAPKLPVAMVTGNKTPEEAKRVLELGAYDYVLKPVHFSYLKQVIFVKLGL